MKIVQIAPFEESVPPKKYGGTELVIHNLTEGLTKKGHDVSLIATQDSKTSAKLISPLEKPIRKERAIEDPKSRESFKYIGIGETLKIVNSMKKIDIIHNHIGWRLIPFLSSFNAPSLTTLHSPLFEYQQIIYNEYKKCLITSISDSQRKPLPNLNYAATVYNGIDINLFDFKKTQGKYLAFLGRISPEKGTREAILTAKKTNLPLKIAAKLDKVDQEYFQKKVNPLIDGKQIQYIGEIGSIQKNIFLKNAMALLAPVQWEEPFGLFMVEAMACGTPVIAFNRGSIPEIIENKKTGFIVNNLKEMIKAIPKISSIKRRDCRERVEKKFTSEIMIKEYEKVYNSMIRE